MKKDLYTRVYRLTIMKSLLLIILLAVLVSVSAFAVLEQAEVIDIDAFLNYLLPQEIKTEIGSIHFEDPLEALAFQAKTFEKQQDISEE